jgi:hypothetical protein
VELSKAKHATTSGRRLNPAISTPCDPKQRPATTHTRPKRHSTSRALDTRLSKSPKHFPRRREVSPNPTHPIAIIHTRRLQTAPTTPPTAFWPHRIDQRRTGQLDLAYPTLSTAAKRAYPSPAVAHAPDHHCHALPCTTPQHTLPTAPASPALPPLEEIPLPEAKPCVCRC